MPDHLVLNCGVLRLGETLYIMAIGGEPVYDLTRVLQPLIPESDLMFFGYIDATAYVPSDKILEEGG